MNTIFILNNMRGMKILLHDSPGDPKYRTIQRQYINATQLHRRETQQALYQVAYNGWLYFDVAEKHV